MLNGNSFGHDDAAVSYSRVAAGAHHSYMDTTIESSWTLGSALSELHGLSYGGEPDESGCAGELDLTLGWLTPANDVAYGHAAGQTPTHYLQA